MSVNSTIVLAGGAFVSLTNFLFGRYLAFLAPEQHAKLKQSKPGIESLAALHKFGWVIIFFTPVLLGLFAYVVFSGMVG